MNLGTLAGVLLDRIGFSLTGRWPKLSIHRQVWKRKLFGKNKLVFDERQGYWCLSEMPTESDLQSYYSEEYWGHRGDQQDFLNGRDLSHYFDLRKHNSDLFLSPSTKHVLNFGAGHGGISHILWGLGFHVYNVDPSTPPLSYPERWHSFTSIENLIEHLEERKLSLIYASHALEHVPDIHSTLGLFAALSKPETVFMFEVPDSHFPGMGGSDGSIHPPHTYYYTFNFFTQNFQVTTSLKSVNSSAMFKFAGNIFGSDLSEGGGDVIRFMGRGILSQNLEQKK